jgi:ubiquitin carboxyl-terminal hydrolase 14
MEQYSKTSRISRLPKYLAVNFIRFQWKSQEKIKAKILKKVQFPFELDMVPFCTPELQSKLQPAKERLKVVADRKSDELVLLMLKIRRKMAHQANHRNQLIRQS